MNLRTKLAALFLPTRRLIGAEAGDADAPAARTGGLLGGQQWVVPRADCQYRRADLSGMPPRHRETAARLAATRYLPPADAVAHIAWREGFAHLWIWSSPPGGVAAGDQRWLPESLLFAPPAQDEARILRTARGFEGQLWMDGQLVLSQWWPHVPDSGAWQRFLRAGGLESDIAVPAPLSLPWSEPWGEGRRNLLPGSAAGRERLAWLAAGVLVAVLLGWELTGLARWSAAGSRLSARLDATRAEIAPLLAAREAAEAAQAEADRLRGLQSGVSDYALMARIVAALPEGILLRAWNRNEEKLEVGVTGGDADPRKYVVAFAGDPQLGEVSATPVAEGMRLVFSLAAPAGDAP